MNTCGRSQSLWSSNAWRMAEFHKRPKVKPYPLLNPGIWPQCMMVVSMCYDWKVTAQPWLTRDFPTELKFQQSNPWESRTFSFQISTQIIQAQWFGSSLTSFPSTTFWFFVIMSLCLGLVYRRQLFLWQIYKLNSAHLRWEYNTFGLLNL